MTTKYKVWRTYEGKDIPYPEIEDTHLANILNWMENRPYQFSKQDKSDIEEEAKRRGLTEIFLKNAPYTFKDKYGNLMISKNGGIVKADQKDIDKEKFFKGIAKRAEEAKSEELYYDAYYKRRLQDLKKFHRFYEDFLANDGYLDGYCEADEDWFYEMRHDKDFMNEYERRHHGGYGWQDYDEPVKPKPYKPLDDPKLHEKIQQTVNNFGPRGPGGSMCLSQKGVNKLNGLKVGEEKFVELTQASSEAKTITVDLVSLLASTEQFKGLKLGKDAILKAVDLAGDSLSVKISIGEVAREENAMMTAALVQLVNSQSVPAAPRASHF